MDTTHLKRRRQGWYVRLKVPAALRAVMGRPELVRSLQTRDLAEANRKKHAVLAQIQRELTQAGLAASLPKESAEYVMQIAKAQRAAVLSGAMSEQMAEAGLEVALEEHLERLRPAEGYDAETGEARPTAARERTLKLAHRMLRGDDAELLSDAVAQYLAEIKPRVRNQTHREKRRHLGGLASWLQSDCEVTAITKKIAAKYLRESLTQHGHAPKTLKDTLSNLSAFWVWLEGRGLVELNPWRGMSGTIKSSTCGTKLKRRPWTNEELTKLVQAIPAGDPLLPLTITAMYTGMRREEVACLRTEDVKQGALTVTAAKSRAARRTVPIHPALQPTIDALLANATDGHLIPGLLPGGTDAKRGHMVGKRFSGLIRSIGFDDPALVFHTLRNAFIQRCEEGGVPESSARLLVGHSRGASLTYGDAGYRPGVQLETLRKEIAKVSYGKPLDDLVRSLGGNVKVTKQSRPRYRTRRVTSS